MTCGGCEKHVSDAVYGVAGVIEIKASYADKNTVVIYDGEQTGPEEIAAAIATTGYTGNCVFHSICPPISLRFDPPVDNPRLSMLRR